MRRVALIGHGAMGRRHARALLALPARLTLGGVYDPDPSAASSGFRTYASEAQAIADADVVFIATPIFAHAATVLRALSAGRDVFVEKPIGATERESFAMVEAADRASRRLFVGHSERFNPVVRALRRIVHPESIQSATFCRIGAPRSRGRDVLLNLGVHDFDLAAYLTGARAMAHAAIGREDAADIFLSTRAHCSVRVHVSREGDRERRLVLTTDGKTYCGDLLHFRLTVRHHTSKEERDIALDTEEPLLAQARSVFDALDGRPCEIAEGHDGAFAVRLAEKSLSLLRKPSIFSALPEPRMAPAD